MIGSNRKWLGSARKSCPSVLTARLETRKDLLIRARILERAVDLACGVHLPWRQTIRCVAGLACEDSRVEMASCRVFQHTVLDAVECVTSAENRLMNNRILLTGNHGSRIRERRVTYPNRLR